MATCAGGLLRSGWVCKISRTLANQNKKEKESVCMVKRRGQSKPAWKKKTTNQTKNTTSKKKKTTKTTTKKRKPQTKNNNNLNELHINEGKLYLANG